MAIGGEGLDRKVILLTIAMTAGLGYLGYTYLYTPRAIEIAAMETRLEGLRNQNQTARLLAEQDGEGAVQRQLTVYRNQLVQVEGLIPSSEELPDLLDAISMEAGRSGVDVSLIQPTGAFAAEFYTRRTYELGVLGSYHQIANFLTRVGSLPRIVSPMDLHLTLLEAETRSGDPQLEAKFSIETYVLPSTDPVADENAG